MNTSSVPPPPPPVSGAAAQPVQLPLATVSSPPAALMKLDIGAAFLATVLTGKVPGQPQTVESPYGQLFLKLPQSLPQNAQLGLKLQTLTPQPQLLVTSVNGKPLAGNLGGPQQAGLGQGPQAAATVAATTSAVSIGSGNLITATVLTPGAAQWARGLAGPQGNQTFGQPQSAGQQASTGPKGAASGLTSSAGSGQAVSPSTGGKPLPGQPSSATFSNSASASGLQSTANAQTAMPSLLAGHKSTLPAGLQLEVKIANQSNASPTQQQQPGKISGSSTPAPPPVRLAGTVTGTTPQGQPIVQTSSGYLALDTKMQMEAGSKITLEIPSNQPVAKSASPLPGFPQGETRSWPNLTEALATLREAAPAVADQVMSSAIPKPEPAIGNTVVFFMAALRLANPRNWLGDAAIRVLERERPGLVPRLADDLKKSSRTVNDPNSGDWRVTLVPVDTGQSIQQVAMCMRDAGGDDDGKEGGAGTGTRFIIDLELSLYGRMQLDGLSKEEDRKLDLAIRTASPLPAAMRKDINALFTRSTEALGLTGQLVFLGTANFVKIEGIDVKKDTLGMIV